MMMISAMEVGTHMMLPRACNNSRFLTAMAR